MRTIVTPSKLLISPSKRIFNFGNIYLHQESSKSLRITNPSLLPMKLSFTIQNGSTKSFEDNEIVSSADAESMSALSGKVKIRVFPDDGYIVLLPGETRTLLLSFSPEVEGSYGLVHIPKLPPGSTALNVLADPDVHPAITLLLKNSLGDVYPLTLTGAGIAPPVLLSTTSLQLKKTCLGQPITHSIWIANPSETETQLCEFHSGGTDSLLHNDNPCKSFVGGDIFHWITFSPRIISLKPKQHCRVEITFSPPPLSKLASFFDNVDEQNSIKSVKDIDPTKLFAKLANIFFRKSFSDSDEISNESSLLFGAGSFVNWRNDGIFTIGESIFGKTVWPINISENELLNEDEWGIFSQYNFPLFIKSSYENAKTITKPLFFRVETTIVPPVLELEINHIDFGALAVGTRQVYHVVLHNLSSSDVNVIVDGLNVGGPFTLIKPIKIVPANGKAFLILECLPRVGGLVKEKLIIKQARHYYDKNYKPVKKFGKVINTASDINVNKKNKSAINSEIMSIKGCPSLISGGYEDIENDCDEGGQSVSLTLQVQCLIPRVEISGVLPTPHPALIDKSLEFYRNSLTLLPHFSSPTEPPSTVVLSSRWGLAGGILDFGHVLDSEEIVTKKTFKLTNHSPFPALVRIVRSINNIKDNPNPSGHENDLVSRTPTGLPRYLVSPNKFTILSDETTEVTIIFRGEGGSRILPYREDFDILIGGGEGLEEEKDAEEEQEEIDENGEPIAKIPKGGEVLHLSCISRVWRRPFTIVASHPRDDPIFNSWLGSTLSNLKEDDLTMDNNLLRSLSLHQISLTNNLDFYKNISSLPYTDVPSVLAPPSTEIVDTKKKGGKESKDSVANSIVLSHSIDNYTLGNNFSTPPLLIHFPNPFVDDYDTSEYVEVDPPATNNTKGIISNVAVQKMRKQTKKVKIECTIPLSENLLYESSLTQPTGTFEVIFSPEAKAACIFSVNIDKGPIGSTAGTKSKDKNIPINLSFTTVELEFSCTQYKPRELAGVSVGSWKTFSANVQLKYGNNQEDNIPIHLTAYISV